VKINVWHIIASHFATLRNDKTGGLSLVDIGTFYAVPVLIAAAVALHAQRFPDAFYGLAISVFSIFAALLFSVQIALFSILQRDMRVKSLPEAKAKTALERRIEQRRDLMREVNANISYLILVACLGVAMLLAFSLTVHLATLRSAVSSYLVSHFVLTVLLVIARVHTLFDEEYRRP
jgi:hypothetical protein